MQITTLTHGCGMEEEAVIIAPQVCEYLYILGWQNLEEK